LAEVESAPTIYTQERYTPFLGMEDRQMEDRQPNTAEDGAVTSAIKTSETTDDICSGGQHMKDSEHYLSNCSYESWIHPLLAGWFRDSRHCLSINDTAYYAVVPQAIMLNELTVMPALPIRVRKNKTQLLEDILPLGKYKRNVEDLIKEQRGQIASPPAGLPVSLTDAEDNLSELSESVVRRIDNDTVVNDALAALPVTSRGKFDPPGEENLGKTTAGDQLGVIHAEILGETLATDAERTNYASGKNGAKVLNNNKEMKNAEAILLDDRDSYLITPCSASKHLVIELSEEVLLDTIILSNYEFFSSTPHKFHLKSSQKYPAAEWQILGQFEASRERAPQRFKLQHPQWARFLSLDWDTYYGREHFCTISLIQVHGKTVEETLAIEMEEAKRELAAVENAIHPPVLDVENDRTILLQDSGSGQHSPAQSSAERYETSTSEVQTENSITNTVLFAQMLTSTNQGLSSAGDEQFSPALLSIKQSSTSNLEFSSAEISKARYFQYGNDENYGVEMLATETLRQGAESGELGGEGVLKKMFRKLTGEPTKTDGASQSRAKEATLVTLMTADPSLCDEHSALSYVEVSTSSSEHVSTSSDMVNATVSHLDMDNCTKCVGTNRLIGVDINTTMKPIKTSAGAGTGGGFGSPARGEHILKTLVSKVRALELNQSLFDGYIEELNRKYIETLNDLDAELELLTEHSRKCEADLLTQKTLVHKHLSDLRHHLEVSTAQKLYQLNTEVYSLKYSRRERKLVRTSAYTCSATFGGVNLLNKSSSSFRSKVFKVTIFLTLLNGVLTVILVCVNHSHVELSILM